MKDTFQCPVSHCQKAYKNMFNLRRHIDVMHIGVYKHKCTICNKALTRKQYLKEHMYTHTGDRPYQCQIQGCGMQFRQRSQYSIHKKEHLHIKNCSNVEPIMVKRESFDSLQLPPLQQQFVEEKLPSLKDIGLV